MEQSLNEDIETTHEVLNYLNACSQGAFAALNMLSQLGYRDFNPEDLSRTQAQIAQIQKWTDLLWKGVPIISRTSKSQTPDSKECYAVATRLRQDLATVVSKIEKIHLIGPDLSRHPEEVRYLMGAYSRFAYTNENFIKGFIEFAKNFTFPDILAQYTNILPQAEHYVESAHMFFDIFTQSPNVDMVFYKGIYEESLFLPGVFRSNIHDLSRFIAIPKGPYTFEIADVPADEAQLWHHLGYDATQAGYWRAYALKPDEAQAWAEVGLLDPRTAFFWRLFRFPPAEAREWSARGFDAPLARIWADSRYTPDDAILAIQGGAASPEEALKGNSPEKK